MHAPPAHRADRPFRRARYGGRSPGDGAVAGRDVACTEPVAQRAGRGGRPPPRSCAGEALGRPSRAAGSLPSPAPISTPPCSTPAPPAVGSWKSTNGGGDWTPVFDAAASQSVGAIAISPRDVNDVWVGTGEAWPRNDVIPGDGLYHSTDGGKTWARAGTARHLADRARHPRSARPETHPRRGARRSVSPTRPNAESFAAPTAARPGRRPCTPAPSVGASDLAVDPHNPDVLYAGMWRFRRTSWSLSSGGDDDGLYKSTDGGASWHKLGADGLPSGPGRTDRGRLRAGRLQTDLRDRPNRKKGLLWRSDDARRDVEDDPRPTRSSTNGRSTISRIVVDPHDRGPSVSPSPCCSPRAPTAAKRGT